VAEPSVLLFGDTIGLPRLLRVLDRGLARALVRAEIRPAQAPDLATLAEEHDLPLLVQPRAEESGYRAFVERVRELAPELILADSYSMLIRPEVLELPALGAVNVHYAPLPRYRGPNPTQWAIVNGESETGVTVHYMTEAADAGEIIAQRIVPIEPTDTWVDVHARLEPVAERLLGEQLPRILEGTAERTPQDEAAATQFPRRTPDDGRIDWSWSVERIHNLIRALVAPLPGAFYESDGERIVIDRYLSLSEVTALKRNQIGR
jgi:methionyl-tRNA formyltransferase